MMMHNGTQAIEVAAAVVVHNNKVLLTRRKGGDLNQLWEFPGGKLEKNETAAHAAKRELAEELDIHVSTEETLLVLEYQYPNKLIRLHFVACRLHDEPTTCLEKIKANSNANWFVPEEFPLADFCPADKIAAGKLPWQKILK